MIISIPHYGQSLKHPNFITELWRDLGLERHAFERIIYLAPIIWAGFLFGQRGAMITSLAALACMLPRAILVSPYSTDSILESLAIFVVGNLVAFTFQSLRKERERRIQLEMAERTLQLQLQVIKENEKRLSALNQTSAILSQSLELKQVLDKAIENIRDVMRADAVLIFLLDEQTGELVLTAYQGVSPRFAEGMGRLKLGEGLNGVVAQTGEPLFVEDTSTDPRLTKTAVRDEGIQSQLIVPLKSKGEIMGTICTATRSQRRFLQDEIEMLTAVGNQIGVAIENARLYEKEREVVQQLRASEERYRELFESAYDAIWLHDMSDNIIVANEACVGLTGYSLKELLKLKADRLFPADSLKSVKEAEEQLLKGKTSGSISEVKLIKKDGSEAFIQLATSLLMTEGQPTAIQHIARDVTEEKRMQENLRFYLEQVTRAQEEERKRIARELHDDTIQALVVLSRQLDDMVYSGKGLSDENKVLLENLRQQTNNIMDGVRRLTQDLRPATLDRLGLLPALEWLASDIGEHSGITVEVKVLGTERRLPVEVELVLFRITQEALRNVWRHAQATKAQVTIEFGDKKTRITVQDNGKGFDLPGMMGDLVKAGRLGLAGMQERAQLLGGSAKVESQPGKGTSVTVEAPV